MIPTYEDSTKRSELDAVLLGEYDGDNIYVFYPTDASDEDLQTMWIRSPEDDTTLLTEQQ